MHEEIDYFVGLPFCNMTPQNAARRDGLPLKGNHTAPPPPSDLSAYMAAMGRKGGQISGKRGSRP